MKPDLRVFSDLQEMSFRAAQATVRTINDAVRARGTCSLVLAGGSTPRALYGLLASAFRELIPWEHVHVFWGDERYVPADDSQSNYRMARQTLLAHVPCPATNVHPIATFLATPERTALDYEATLKSVFAGDWPRFDLVLLGLGEDGHIASLFPNSSASRETTRWVVATQAPTEPRARLTLTLPALNRAAAVYFLVSGPSKAQALHHALARPADTNAHPAAGIQPESGTLIWWADREAAAIHERSVSQE